MTTSGRFEGAAEVPFGVRRFTMPHRSEAFWYWVVIVSFLAEFQVNFFPVRKSRNGLLIKNFWRVPRSQTESTPTDCVSRNLADSTYVTSGKMAAAYELTIAACRAVSIDAQLASANSNSQ